MATSRRRHAALNSWECAAFAQQTYGWVARFQWNRFPIGRIELRIYAKGNAMRAVVVILVILLLLGGGGGYYYGGPYIGGGLGTVILVLLILAILGVI
jgi:hypothetical protein